MNHGQVLDVERCPHCNIAKPRLERLTHYQTENHAGGDPRFWGIYACFTCGGVTLAMSQFDARHHIQKIWPASESVDDSIPARARQFLSQAITSIHAPAGAVMLAGSAIDAMLKDKGLKDGSLYSRIKKAETEHLITSEMALWAHEVRLEANDQRHADEEAELPEEADARKVIEFAKALAQFMFVLPAQVARARET